MGECEACGKPWCDPRGSCMEPDYGAMYDEHIANCTKDEVEA